MVEIPERLRFWTHPPLCLFSEHLAGIGENFHSEYMTQCAVTSVHFPHVLCVDFWHMDSFRVADKHLVICWVGAVEIRFRGPRNLQGCLVIAFLTSARLLSASILTLLCDAKCVQPTKALFIHRRGKQHRGSYRPGCCDCGEKETNAFAGAVFPPLAETHRCSMWHVSLWYVWYASRHIFILMPVVTVVKVFITRLIFLMLICDLVGRAVI